jgi:GNAT superfamily N-acetyltransferase
MIPTPETVLDDLYELFIDPDHWTKGWPARLINGDYTNPLDLQAVKWCLTGGLNKVVYSKLWTGTGDHLVELYQKVFEILEQQLRTDKSLASFNDSSTHAQVIDLIDAARKSLRNNSGI